jgi:4,5-DOPA dioxygenase extradiol
MNELPTLFVTHGAPTLPLEPEPARAAIAGLAALAPSPSAVVAISAHWETEQPRVSAAPQPETIHDFSGFPAELYRLRYPARGAPDLAPRIAALLEAGGIRCRIDPTRGLDHGAWVPLMLMYPEATIPVLQLSVQPRAGAAHHARLGALLAPLRKENVLILGSGSATHNLGEFGRYRYDDPPPDYVAEFDRWLGERIERDDRAALLDYRLRAPAAARNHPTEEHLLPLFVPLGAAHPGEHGRRLHGFYSYGIIAMSAFAWGAA